MNDSQRPPELAAAIVDEARDFLEGEYKDPAARNFNIDMKATVNVLLPFSNNDR